MSSLKLHPIVAPTYQQLTLPGMEPQTLPPPLPPAPPMVQPQELWASLVPSIQTQVRQTILHILQEVLHDHPQP